MPFPALLAPVLGKLGVKGVAVILAALVIGGLVLRVMWLDAARDAAVVDAQHHAQRADSLAARVIEADRVVREAGAVNARQAAALDVQTRAIGVLRAEAERQEAAADAAQAKVLAAAGEARKRDRERRARADLPSADEMAGALREAIEGLR